MSASPTIPTLTAKVILRQGKKLCLGCVLLGGAVSAIAFVNLHWPYRYRNVEPVLEKVFASQIKIEHYHRTYFPDPGFVADGLTLRRNSAPNLPPVGSVAHLEVKGRWIDLLLLRNRIRLVKANGLHVIIPPAGSAANKEDFPPGSSNDFTGPTTIVEQFDLQNATLDLQRSDGGRYRFPIRRLQIGNLHAGETISYVVEMQNAKPSGRIQAHGSFGPLLANQLDRTPVSGEFTFTSVNLSEIQGIAGNLSATGHFTGQLAAIEAQAQSATPDFAVGSGHRTSVDATTHCAVDALNGDVILHAVDLHTGKTITHVEGTIAGAEKVTNITFLVRDGRVEDLLRPFITGQSPVKGAVALHGHAVLAPAAHGATFFERLKVEGAFNVPGERFTDHETESNLTALSQRAQGESASQYSGPDAGVLSNVTATVSIRDGIASMAPLALEVPGAVAHLKGTFDLQSQEVHMAGDLRMQSDLSHLTTGFKSLLLKPLAPFFKKKNAGAVVPIALTGSPDHYKVGQNIIPH